MSISLMSLVFYADIPDLEYIHQGFRKVSGEPFKKNIKVTGASSKSVLLAYADHAQDDGGSAYPSVSRLMVKTGLSRVSITRAKQALVKAGYMTKVGKSERDTDSVVINIDKLNLLQNNDWSPFRASKPSLPSVVNPVYQEGSKPSLPESSVLNPSSKPLKEGRAAPNNNGAKPKPKKKRDPLLDHPAIIEYREIARFHVPIVWRERVVEAVGDNVDLWKSVVFDWIGRGYNPRNVKDMLDAFHKGGLPNKNGNGRRPMSTGSARDAEHVAGAAKYARD